jgi:hypothetical protein
MIKRNASVAIISSLIIISSCANLPPVAYVDITSSLYRQAFGFKDTVISQDYYDQFEYSFLRAQLGKSQDVILVLAFVKNDIYEWVSSDQISIFTRDGRIIETRGLPHDMKIIKDRRNLDDLDQGNTFYEKINFTFPSLYLASYVSELSKENNYRYTFLGAEEMGYKIFEKASIKEIGWSIKNQYIYSASGRPVSTIQELHPSLPQVKLDFYIK